MTEHSQKNITLGTAGHIDHGKTALIRLLTGCETDRLKEEKERGMSIELGFAPCRLGDLEVGIVDVPGHEHFIKTMVAGATGIDGVIFVVAADDGIMPQTQEHLQILTLLGVRYGMVALTKIDIVSGERVATVKAELAGFLRGTFLEDADICPLSAITGAGFDGFYKSLKSLIARIEPRGTDGIFQMPVERVFSVKGFGTIVSGIPAGGMAKVGEELILLPEGAKSRVRAIQVYGKEAQQVRSGQCAAVNLPQLDASMLRRGQVLTRGDCLKAAHWFTCDLQVLEAQDEPIRNGRQYKFHTGTSETTAVVYVLTEPDADGRMLVQVRTEEPVAAGIRNAFILRQLSPMRTCGGGMIIETGDRRVKRRPEVVDELRARAQVIGDADRFVAHGLRTGLCGTAAPTAEIARTVQQTTEKVAQVLENLTASGEVVQMAGQFIHREVLAQLEARLREQVELYHRQNAQSPGIEEEALCGLVAEPKPLIKAVLGRILAAKQLTVVKDRIALPTHTQQFDPRQKQMLDRIEALFLQKMFCPPSVQEMTAALKTNDKAVEQAIKILVEQQTLRRVEQGMYFHAEAIAQARSRIAKHVQGKGQGRLESVDFKYLVDTTRKYALPLLDYMDKIGFTRRSGNTRYLKQ
jgi:selenocysteine-specific elongation factor